jgi:hypothetical protein
MKISELPKDVKKKALKYQKNEKDKMYNKKTDDLVDAFDWEETKEGVSYWIDWDDKEIEKTQPHYDNTNGSLYKFANDQNLNSWEFDVVKRIVRCRKKGEFETDLKKTIEVINLYLKEYEN